MANSPTPLVLLGFEEGASPQQEKAYSVSKRSTLGRNRYIAEFIKNEVPKQAFKYN